ncbi:prohibitin family protein [Bacillus inaquosorum]|uniref:prohibitin family protein n=1 Tax=Bacillus inaquosorum TaxID=483913 RepID=UPI00227F9AD4|nr:prohibitin family protein [Bacillus inaquosorum]MCY9308788.1 prohibitin family protein [Bacillus inaquosorum]
MTKKPFVIGGSVVGALIFLFGILTPFFVEKVSPGNVGLVYNPNGGIEKGTLDPGWHGVGFFKKVIQYPTKLHTIEYKNMVVSTKDGKNIKVDLSYSYKVDPSKVVELYNEFGNVPVEDIQQGFLQKRMLAAARKSVSNYNLLSIYGADATKAGLEIQKDFEEDVKHLGFMVQDVTLGSPKPDNNTQKAIDSRIKASQETEKKKIELENEKIEAEKKEVIADGNAQKKLIEAKAEAESNKIISKSVTPELLNKMEMDARLAHGWVTVEGGTPLIDAGKAGSDKSK